MVNLAIKEKADLVSGYLKRVYKNIPIKTPIPHSLSKYRVYDVDDIRKEILPSFFGITNFPRYMPTKLYKNAIIKKSLDFDSPVHFFQEDIAFNLQMCLIAKSIAVMPDIVYYYRVGGLTSKFMPFFLIDCISLYKFKIGIIEKNKLPESYVYTTCVELKNELWTWLVMYYEQYRGVNNISQIKQEIHRCCNIKEVIEVVNCPKDDSSGIFGFRNLVKEKKVDDIYELLSLNDYKWSKKKLIKILLK